MQSLVLDLEALEKAYNNLVNIFKSQRKKGPGFMDTGLDRITFERPSAMKLFCFNYIEMSKKILWLCNGKLHPSRQNRALDTTNIWPEICVDGLEISWTTQNLFQSTTRKDKLVNHYLMMRILCRNFTFIYKVLGSIEQWSHFAVCCTSRVFEKNWIRQRQFCTQQLTDGWK